MEQPVRALLLAAGLGSRLRPLTNEIPKCLVPIGGKPLLERWLTTLENAGCESVLINTHYLPNKVKKFLDSREKNKMSILDVYEPNLLGTAKTLINNIGFFANSTGLLIHADNATDVDLREIIKVQETIPKDCLLTMLTFSTKSPSSCGIVEINEAGIVSAFHEKIENPPGNKANGAIYAFGKDFLEYLKTMDPNTHDFSTQVLPLLCGKIQTLHTDENFIDIGTPENLLKAQALWPDTNYTNK